jgi:flagellar motility protein MotE (MotC chaperone)
MSSLDSDAEILKLAHQLGVPTAQLDFLGPVAPDELRALRGQIGDALFRADKHHFSKVVAVSRIVPGALAAKITEHALSPLIAARTAELLDPPRAVDMVGRLSERYLADVSAAMDPSRAPEVLSQIPPDRVAAVGLELARRGEWVVMGGFVSVVSTAALKASVAVLTGEQLLRIGFVLDDMSRLDDIADILTGEQLDEMLAAAIEHELWRELDELLANLDPDRAQLLAARYASADPATVRAVEAAVADGSLSPASLAKLESL